LKKLISLSEPLYNKWEWYKHTKRREYGAANIFLRSHLDWQKAFWYNDGKTTTTITAGAKSVSLCELAAAARGKKEMIARKYSSLFHSSRCLDLVFCVQKSVSFN
jgi:hypothetical protein